MKVPYRIAQCQRRAFRRVRWKLFLPLGVGIAIGIGIDFHYGVFGPSARSRPVDVKSLVAAAHAVTLDSDTDSDPDADWITAEREASQSAQP